MLHLSIAFVVFLAMVGPHLVGPELYLGLADKPRAK